MQLILQVVYVMHQNLPVVCCRCITTMFGQFVVVHHQVLHQRIRRIVLGDNLSILSINDRLSV